MPSLRLEARGSPAVSTAAYLSRPSWPVILRLTLSCFLRYSCLFFALLSSGCMC